MENYWRNSKMKVKKLGLFIVLSILALLVVGCSNSSTEDDKKNTDSTADLSYTGGDLHVALNTQPPSLDPHMGMAIATRDAVRPIFETLVTLNANYEVEPMLAERFEQSDDGLVFTFYLREGVRFHNGKEMKAEDVVASLKRWIEKAGRAQNAIGDGKFEVLNDYTVQLSLPQPSVGALHVLAATNQMGAIMPKELVENAPDEGIKEYIGTGPFKFVEWKQDQYIHYERYDEYLSPEGTPSGLAGKREALVDNLYIDFVVDSSTRVAGLSTEQYDIGINMPVDSYDQLKSYKNLHNEVALSSSSVVVFNEKEGLLSNPAMRQAFNMAMDYEEVLLAGFTDPEFYRLSPGIMYPEQADWYTDAGKENFNPNNPERAKKMFEEAGYNGETIKILTTRDYESLYNTAIVIQAQLEKIGVNVKLDVVDWPTLMQLFLEPSAYDVFTSGFSAVTDPTQHLIFDPAYAGWNDDPKTADLVAKIRTSATPAEAFPHWEELQEHTWITHLPYIRFGDSYSLFSYTDKVTGFNQFEGIVPWNVGKK